jgi:hypothetical protein
MKISKSIIKLLLPVLCTTLLADSCKKQIQVGPPPNVLTPDKVFSSDSSAIAATLSDYTSLNGFDANFIPYAGQYVDELTQPTLNSTSTEFANSDLTITNGPVASIWQNLYVTIYKANANIEQLKIATVLSDSVKNQCTGEALFIRAYCHFNLVNIFGAVPLITVTNVAATSNAPGSPVSQVYNQITTDLLTAIPLLSTGYPSGEKIRANRWAAQALLARVYLYEQNWPQAEAQSSAVIGTGLYPLSPIDGAFYENSNEAIWQLWNINGFSGLSAFLTPPLSGKPAYTVSSNLLNSIEPGDLRGLSWMKSITVAGNTYVSPYKYKLRTVSTGVNAEYTMYLRSAEQYLIRAEARAAQNLNLSGAIADLNIIRSRAGLPRLAFSLTQAQVLDAVAHERRIELFAEAGHRFFDLKRTGQINQVMTALKSSWNPQRSPLFPIPKGQISVNSSLIQNPGY